MSRSQPPSCPRSGPELREADEDQVVRWIGGWLMDAAPEGWRRIDLTVRLTTSVEEISPAAVMPDGAVARMELPPDVSLLLFELRTKKYLCDRGTWLSLRLVIEPDGAYRISYNYDREGIKGEPNTLLKSVADYLKFSLPAGWEYLQLRYRAVGDHEESGAVVHSITGTVYPWTPPEQVIDLLRRHRAVSASEDRGTWASLKYEMSFPESVKAQFNATEDPGFRQRPPASAYAEELRRYPRSERRTPGWLRQ